LLSEKKHRLCRLRRQLRYQHHRLVLPLLLLPLRRCWC